MTSDGGCESLGPSMKRTWGCRGRGCSGGEGLLQEQVSWPAGRVSELERTRTSLLSVDSWPLDCISHQPPWCVPRWPHLSASWLLARAHGSLCSAISGLCSSPKEEPGGGPSSPRNPKSHILGGRFVQGCGRGLLPRLWPAQRDLYGDVILKTDSNMVSMDLAISKPDVSSFLDQG